MSDPVASWLGGEREAILERLFAFVRHPSVGGDPAYAEGMRGAQEFLLQRLRDLGLRDVRRLEAGGTEEAEVAGRSHRPQLRSESGRQHVHAGCLCAAVAALNGHGCTQACEGGPPR